MKKKVDETDILLKSVAKGMFQKMGSDVLKIDLRKLENRIADYFVICHGSSVTRVASLCESVEDTVRKEAAEKPLHIEGLENCYWVLLDYGNVIVHIFLEEYRTFYSLESLWADADIEALIDEESKEQVYGRKQ
ncbi:MAG: ribosome silencing factor [Bacteroidales bacterium]|nr:ribosome silencing factor [Bacteroidales bacterium]MBN2634361.1 ribosome silencing factor [Bacteroidales bacterium]